MFGFEYEIVKEYPAYFLDYQEHDDEETRWTDRIVSNLGDWSGNLFDFYFRICNRIIQEAKTPFKLEGMTRVDDTPVHKALREALANSLIHANYYDRLGLVVHRRPQSITISNPGGLRISLEDALDGGISDPRNFTLFKMFNMLNIGERAGSGIPNIYYVWKTQGWQEPTLIEQFNPDRTILSLALTAQKSQNITSNITKNITKNITVNKTQKKILELMLENPSITTEMMSSQIGIADRNIKTNIKKLRDSGLIDRVGARKNGDWIVKEEQ
ncbi:MAG: winged helix-turn-helix transcriptional regulator [Clostridiales bacterium]|nr:winged helix-turn-helix transcriptional regulator [Clostridiales bacterium]